MQILLNKPIQLKSLVYSLWHPLRWITTGISACQMPEVGFPISAPPINTLWELLSMEEPWNIPTSSPRSKLAWRANCGRTTGSLVGLEWTMCTFEVLPLRMSELESEPRLHDPRENAFAACTVLPFIPHSVYCLCPSSTYSPSLDRGQCQQYFVSLIDILQVDKIPLLLFHEHLLPSQVHCTFSQVNSLLSVDSRSRNGAQP